MINENVFDHLKKEMELRNDQMNKECIQAIANMVNSLQTNADGLRILIAQGLMPVLHSQLVAMMNNGIILMYAIQTLQMVFRQLPNEVGHYLSKFGSEAIENMQYSDHETVRKTVASFLEEFFDCVEENDELFPETSGQPAAARKSNFVI